MEYREKEEEILFEIEKSEFNLRKMCTHAYVNYIKLDNLFLIYQRIEIGNSLRRLNSICLLIQISRSYPVPVLYLNSIWFKEFITI